MMSTCSRAAVVSVAVVGVALMASGATRTGNAARASAAAMCGRGKVVRQIAGRRSFLPAKLRASARLR